MLNEREIKKIKLSRFSRLEKVKMFLLQAHVLTKDQLGWDNILIKNNSEFCLHPIGIWDLFLGFDNAANTSHIGSEKIVT